MISASKKLFLLVVGLALCALPALAADVTPTCDQGVYDNTQHACAVATTLSEPATETAMRSVSLVQGSANAFHRQTATNSIVDNHFAFSVDKDAGTWTVSATYKMSGSGSAPHWSAHARIYRWDGSSYGLFSYASQNYTTYSTHTVTLTKPNSGTTELLPGSYCVASFDTSFYGGMFFDIDSTGLISNVQLVNWDGTTRNYASLSNGPASINYSCPDGETLNGTVCEYPGTSYVTPTCPAGYDFVAVNDTCAATVPAGPTTWGGRGNESTHAYYRLQAF